MTESTSKLEVHFVPVGFRIFTALICFAVVFL